MSDPRAVSSAGAKEMPTVGEISRATAGTASGSVVGQPSRADWPPPQLPPLGVDDVYARRMPYEQA